MTGLVLASASAVRARLLRAAGVAFEVAVAHVDEDAIKDSLLVEKAAPCDIAMVLAELKAQRISASLPDMLVVGADQVLEFDGELLSKSRDPAEAHRQLARLRGHEHMLITAVALAKAGSVFWWHTETAKLHMRDFSDAFLDDYLAEEGEDILQSVGAYHLEGRGVQLFDRIEGDYFSILGVPLVPLLAALRREGLLLQ
jgi:septum formation protein